VVKKSVPLLVRDLPSFAISLSPLGVNGQVQSFQERHYAGEGHRQMDQETALAFEILVVQLDGLVSFPNQPCPIFPE
jgi:hypothetical protein